MHRTRYLTAVGLLTMLLVPGVAAAQDEEDDRMRLNHRPFELNVNAGGHKLDGAEETDLGVGGRLALHHRSGLSFVGSFTWVTSTVDLVTEEVDVHTYYYNAELEYTIPAGLVEPFLGAGAGAQTIKLDDVSGTGTLSLASSEEDSHSETNLMVPLTAGFKVLNGSRRFGLRVEIRDNMVFVKGDEDEGTEDEATHNWEISGGLSFLFGGS